MNFLEETEVKIKASGHNINDVMFIGKDDGKLRMPWWRFVETADFNYDSGYGYCEIPTNLIVYFKDNTYLFRNEYDGSEWWEYRVSKIFTPEDEYDNAMLTYTFDNDCTIEKEN